MIIIDEARIFKEIDEKNPASVSLNGPDGMLPQVQDMAIKISTKYDIPAYVLADTTWGTCDLNTTGSKILGAEIQFNIGHTINTESLEKNLVLIDACMMLGLVCSFKNDNSSKRKINFTCYR